MVQPGRTFEDFYRAEWASVRRAVGFAVGEAELARDCVDEAMTRAYERWDQVGRMDRPAGWVYRVAINQARNRGRRRKVEWARRPAPLAPGPGADTVADTVADPAIAAAVALLPVEQRAVVVLRFYLDWSTEEVARALDIAEGTVKSRLHRALRRLENSLREPA
ncbi:MAG TPA: sigma-70 family RNA polymerase sigma factor [Acidimicrobiales bacterium]|nr:sigma-70 family RNA polymerase sigma factor [Acidimicrobiales bacterium]